MTRRSLFHNPVLAAAACLIAVIFCAPLAAHGGQYRGLPNPFTPGGPSPFAPQSGPKNGPMSPRVPVPKLAATSWEFWWFCNREEFLPFTPNMRAAEAAETVPKRGHNQELIKALSPSEKDLQAYVLPELFHQLRTSRSRDVKSACIIALAKIGMDQGKHQLIPVFKSVMKKDGQQVRESAALALGITHRPEALPILIDLIRNTRRGQKYVARNEVGDRTRAFAVYGLGLLAHNSNDLAIKEAAFEVLSEQIKLRSQRDPDILVAAVQALGAINPDTQHAGHKRLLWRILPALYDFSNRKLGRSREATQAHVPTAVARLLGRGHSVDHQRWKARFLKRVTKGKKPHVNIAQSIALALGRMVEAPEDHPEDAVYSELLQKKHKKDKDQLIQSFALIALGRIGGEDNRSYLLKVFNRRSKTPLRSWAALSLGILGYRARETGKPDNLVGKALFKPSPQAKRKSKFKIARPKDAQSIALALTGYTLAGPATASEYLAGLRAITGNPGLGILEGQLLNPETPPHILVKIAQGLQLYGNRSSMPILVKAMQLKRKEKLPYLVIAFVAAALGGIADKESRAWNWIYRAGTNYAARVPTLENGMDGVLDIL